jgi:hypothetical protein
VAESQECPGVRGHGVLGEEARRDLPQPGPLCGDGLMHSPPQVVLHSPESRPHALASGLPKNLELSLACLPADERETQKGERLRFAKTMLLAPCRCMAAKLDKPGLIRAWRQRKLLQPHAQFFQKPPGLGFVLKAQHHLQ